MKTIYLVTGLLIAFSLISCEKFLSENASNVDGIPNSLKDLRYLLDYERDVNLFYPATLEAGTDDYCLNEQGFNGLQERFKGIYIWQDKGLSQSNWLVPYRLITRANIVLETLERLDDKNPVLRKQLEGEALFLRGTAFFYLAQSFCHPYRWGKDNRGLGLVLRLDSDVEIVIPRASLEDTYVQMLTDLKNALDLLPEYSEYITRPNKSTAAAMLARLYLAIENYEDAEKMVDIALSFNDKLLDYNSVDSLAAYPFTVNGNPELMYIAGSSDAGNYTMGRNAFVAPKAYELYEPNDLRKVVCFEKSLEGVKFKGSYYGTDVGYFSGIAVNELYLIKAECLARGKELANSTDYLNQLLQKRYKVNGFIKLSFNNSDDLLKRILLERRKELIFRGIRWMDLRRLNAYPEHAITLEREITRNSIAETIRLEPNSLEYTYLIPIEAVKFGHYEQNQR
ncbi:RagB/SusD family nutrient uptake outer membrane protein [Sphingobacterium faecale]|uniref:RagB/SusD family nutrient uptake outer membrane protein n=1 Tax=Sphingobacterium faecale TaxID=2803775 RepID=A0ABS1QYW6_9SPHI|nr:RagB/SusD family nutrient uptake outer membrane protein [Sphingobacterium faecale]MBL1407644.1 RagB/SusD family nutrient uptake outer membrane protein [Sphingobacterium faecale]